MRPSDFPKGPDGVRFRVEANVVDRFRFKDNFWPRDEWVWLCNCFDESHANMIAAALERVANWEDNQRKDGEG